jgi:hypothetical protein
MLLPQVKKLILELLLCLFFHRHPFHRFVSCPCLKRFPCCRDRQWQDGINFAHKNTPAPKSYCPTTLGCKMSLCIKHFLPSM